MPRPRNGEAMAAGILTWPNALTALRIPLAIGFLLTESLTTRVVIVVTAGVSDYLDGAVARRTGQYSRIGEVLDPIADKTFVFLALLGLTVGGPLEYWQLAFLLARDIFTALAVAFALATGLGKRFPPRASGKVVTGLQIVTMLVVLLWPMATDVAVLVTGTASVLAAIDYAQAGVRGLRRGAASA